MNNYEMDFTECELKEREYGTILLENILKCTKYKFAEIGSYDKVDGTCWTGDTETSIPIKFEIKVRRMPRDRYHDHFIEKIKLKELAEAHKNGYIVLYIMFFEEDDGRISSIIYNVSEKFNFFIRNEVPLRHGISYRYLPYSTALGGRGGYTYKPCFTLLRHPNNDIIIDNIHINNLI